MNITVNGVTNETESSPLRPLLDVLREEFGITSPKAGCHQGGCGACTVLVDGEARRSCILPAAYAEGAEITTVEGLGTPEHLSTVQQAFVHHYAAQCGFCTSGMLLAAQAYLSHGGTDDPAASTTSASIPGIASVADPGFSEVMPGSGEIRIAPVSVCHHVSTIGQRSPPMYVQYQTQASGLIGSPTLPSSRSDDRSCLAGCWVPQRMNERIAVGAV